MGLSYFKMKCYNDPKNTEVYCGMVHLTNDHQANETTDGHQYFDMWVVVVKIMTV